MEDKKRFYDIVKSERRIRMETDPSFSARRLAVQMGSSPTQLSKIESGEIIPSEEEFQKLSEIFRFDEEKQKEFRSAYEELRDNPAICESIRKAREEANRRAVPLFIDFKDGSGVSLVGWDAELVNGRKSATFRKLTYAEHTWQELPEMLTIIPQDRKVVVNVSGNEMSVECNSADWFKLEIYLTACNFENWQTDYYKPVLDGTTWTLEIEDENGNIRTSTGCNGYPEEWEKFLALKKYCLDLVG